MKSVTLKSAGGVALFIAMASSGSAATLLHSKEIRVQNQSHHTISSVSGHPSAGPKINDERNFGSIPPGGEKVIDLNMGAGCMFNMAADLDGGRKRRVQNDLNICKAGRWVVLDTNDYIEMGGYGKGPVVHHSVPPPLLTEADIQPCNELLSFRSSMYHEPTDLSNLDFALNDSPYEPLYDLRQTKEGMINVAGSITAVETGSEELNQKAFGDYRFRGQEAVERLATDRRGLCMLKVRLRQLQGAGSAH